jgi:hypothetical protein
MREQIEHICMKKAHACMYTYIHTCTRTHKYLRTYVHKYIFLCVCAYVYRHVKPQNVILATLFLSHVCVCIYIYTHTHIYMHTYTDFSFIILVTDIHTQFSCLLHIHMR